MVTIYLKLVVGLRQFSANSGRSPINSSRVAITKVFDQKVPQIINCLGPLRYFASVDRNIYWPQGAEIML